ncbi:uncharacterized protein LOC108048327 isoform X2 [Drosophila rhopaloa]|uniref:Uncharacterized protein LOC108048327 isoform X2 n=1 Tax=Drosophila rhopaloa TaxID=1041015 RepID=A0A6P4F1U2_DRORH|nr:uncharacterized protein LOC108048327 isoform X2 [Drosophila rhopaloa]
MRALLGAESLLSICKYRVRWYSKGKSHLPPKELYDMAMKAIESRQHTISARLRQFGKKASETPTLEIICRALASSSTAGTSNNSDSKDQAPSTFNSQTLKPDCDTLTMKPESQPNLPQLDFATLEIFNCLMIVNCKNCHEDNTKQSTKCSMGKAIPPQQGNSTKEPTSVLKKDLKTPSKEEASKAPPSKQDIKAEGSAKPQESADRFSMPQKSAFPQGRNPCEDGMSQCKQPKKPSCDSAVSCKGPQSDPVRTAPQEEHSVKGKIPDSTPSGKSPDVSNSQINTTASVELKAPGKSNASVNAIAQAKPQVKNIPQNIPKSDPSEGSKDGEKGAEKSKCPTPKPKKCQAAKKEPKPELIKKPEKCKEKEKPKAVAQCKQEKKEDPCPEAKKCLIKGAVSDPSSSSQSKPKSLEQVAPKAKPSQEKSSIQDSINQKQRQDKPTSRPVKATSQQSKEGKLPPPPSSSFSMPLFSAFPMGRNPCRDGPRGAAEEACPEPKDDPCSKPKINPCTSEESSCSSGNKASGGSSCSSEASGKKESSAFKKHSQKDKTSVSPKEIKTTSSEPAASQSPPSASTREILEPEGPFKEKVNTSSKDPIPPAAKSPSPTSPPPPAKELKESVAKAPSPSEIKGDSGPPEDKAKTPSQAPPPKPQEAKDKISNDNGHLKKPCVSLDGDESKLNSDISKDQISFDDCKVKKPCVSLDGDAGKKNSDSSEEKPQPELKKFPVQPLKQTLASYLISIEPLLTEEELKKEQKLTRKFADCEGQDLQKLLEEEAEHCANWLTPRWTRAAYLGYQAPLTVFSSPGLSFPIQEFPEPTDFLNFTAKAIYGACEFKQLVDQNKIPVVQMGKYSLDNSQFSKIFGTVRRPGRFCDTLEQCSDADYVVVVHKNNYFKLPIYCESGELLHVHSLRDALQEIIDCPICRGEPYGLLTHDNRGNWAEAYAALRCPHGNAASVDTIEQSLFLVCLDECVPIGKGEDSIVQAHQLLHGGGLRQNSGNRWMDKTIQLIVNPNGLAGFCYEHSPADCQPLAMLMDFVHEKVKEENYGCDGCDSQKEVTSTLLKFQPMNECINLWMCQAMRNIHKIVSQLQMNVFQFECHGKCFIKAQGLNVDSYIQMALSLAFYSLHKKIAAQYESAHLRIFYEGRTEAIRSTSNESKAFVLAMQSETATRNEKLATLHKAVDAHEKLTKEAIKGQGIDRHLFGLQQMALENGLPLPDFFQSTGFVRSVTFQLFTSQVATSSGGFMAYGPLLSDGYGCCYNPQEDKIIFAISAWKTCPQISPFKYGKAINKSLNAMRRLILETGGDRVGEHPCKCEEIRL